MSNIERLLETARAEIGYTEKASADQLDSKTANPGRANYTKYARDLDRLGIYNGKKNGYAWCDMFCDWCFITTFGLAAALQMTGQPMGGYGAGCGMSASYYKRMGRYHEFDPQPGDQIFFCRDGKIVHTGLVERVSATRVWTIEGNTNRSSGIVANGGNVARKSYSLTYTGIAGYGRPAYDIIEEDDDMTDKEFAKHMDAYLTALKDQPAGAWGAESDEALQWAERVGLIKGDAHGRKMYKVSPDRQQLVIMLYRFYKLIKG